MVIAAALAQASEILLLDEPTASLDLGYQLEVAALLTAAQSRSRRHASSISTHDLNLAASGLPQMVMLRRGTRARRGPTAEVLTPHNVRALYDVEADVQRARRRPATDRGAGTPAVPGSRTSVAGGQQGRTRR